MKLRVLKNTVRLRLKRSEVAQIAAGKSIVEETRFPGSLLTYSLNVSADGSTSARFDNGNLTISLPEPAVRQWAATDQVSIVADQALTGADTLSLLVEKDFECLSPGHHRAGADDEDAYPHPDAGADAGC